MKKTQQQVDDCMKKSSYSYWEPLAQMARLTEEVGELAREINHRYGPKIKKSTEETKEIEDEIGDIVFTLACMANSLGVDMETGFQEAIKKAYGRDKNRYPKKHELHT